MRKGGEIRIKMKIEKKRREMEKLMEKRIRKGTRRDKEGKRKEFVLHA